MDLGVCSSDSHVGVQAGGICALSGPLSDGDTQSSAALSALGEVCVLAGVQTESARWHLQSPAVRVC